MNKFFNLPAWFAVATALVPSTVSAQQSCTTRDELVTRLKEKFQEVQQGFGTLGQEAILELMVAPSGTWTIIITDVTKRSCVVAVGNNWDGVVEDVEAPISYRVRR